MTQPADAATMGLRVRELLLSERATGTRGGLYELYQLDMAYHSGALMGSQLAQGQLAQIFANAAAVSGAAFSLKQLPGAAKHETTAVSGTAKYETTAVSGVALPDVDADEAREAANHFKLFDVMLDSLLEPLTSSRIKQYHALLKEGTSDLALSWFICGDWKRLDIVITGLPGEAHVDDIEVLVERLLTDYRTGIDASMSLYDIVEFHYRFEAIAPFLDGNGRIGRLILFEQCLKNGLTPFMVNSDQKEDYVKGLRGNRGLLHEVCNEAQRRYVQQLAPYL